MCPFECRSFITIFTKENTHKVFSEQTVKGGTRSCECSSGSGAFVTQRTDSWFCFCSRHFKMSPENKFHTRNAHKSSIIVTTHEHSYITVFAFDYCLSVKILYTLYEKSLLL